MDIQGTARLDSDLARPRRHLSAFARWAVRGSGIAMAAFSLSGAVRAENLRFAVSQGPVSLPIYVAEAKGYFEQEGLALRVQECSSGRSCFKLLTDGHADLATAAELLVTLYSFAGSDVAIIATLSSSSHAIKMVARRNGAIQGSQDLRGKRIATVAGTSAQYFLDRWLVFHDIDPKQVDLVPLAPDQLVGALERREVDAIAIWEPIASLATAALGQDAVELPSARAYTQHFSLVASRRAIAQREADLVKLLRALARAERFIAEQPAQAQQILKSRLPGPSGVENLSEGGYRLSLEQSLITTMDGQARWALRQGFGQPSGTLGNLLRSIEPGPLRKAVPGAVNLVQ